MRLKTIIGAVSSIIQRRMHTMKRNTPAMAGNHRNGQLSITQKARKKRTLDPNAIHNTDQLWNPLTQKHKSGKA